MVATLIIAAIIAIVGLYFTVGRKNTKYNYPPSPPGYNFLKGGHAYLLPPNLDVRSFLVPANVGRPHCVTMGKGSRRNVYNISGRSQMGVFEYSQSER
jgi:hypothetical protein